jgi:hypothetical protein
MARSRCIVRKHNGCGLRNGLKQVLGHFLHQARRKGTVGYHGMRAHCGLIGLDFSQFDGRADPLECIEEVLDKVPCPAEWEPHIRELRDCLHNDRIDEQSARLEDLNDLMHRTPEFLRARRQILRFLAHRQAVVDKHDFEAFKASQIAMPDCEGDPQKCMQHVLKQTNWPAEWKPQLEALRENFEAVEPDLHKALCLVKQFELLPGEKLLAERQAHEKRPLQGARDPPAKRVRNCSE